MGRSATAETCCSMVVNISNVLPNLVARVNTTNMLKTRLDKFAKSCFTSPQYENYGRKSLHGIRRNGMRRNAKTPNQDITYHFIAQLQVTRSRSKVIYDMSNLSKQCLDEASIRALVRARKFSLRLHLNTTRRYTVKKLSTAISVNSQRGLGTEPPLGSR